MTIDWLHFMPYASVIGGALIGAAAALLLLFNGKLAGISGILGGLFARSRGDIAWRAAFLLGLMLAPRVYACFAALPAVHIATGNSMLIWAGLLVGFGARLGSGCTSGHGVCGLARLSPRSLSATLCFMSSGLMTVFVLRHWII